MYLIPWQKIRVILNSLKKIQDVFRNKIKVLIRFYPAKHLLT